MPSVSDRLPNYRWPAEWEEHDATWLAWPVSKETWPGIFERIPAAYAKLVAAIARFEPVKLLAGGDGVLASAAPLVYEACEASGSAFAVEFIDIPVNDSWCRDHGPVFLTGIEGSPEAKNAVIIDWDYNAWGGKYPPWDDDALVARRVAQMLQVPTIRPGLILEGGAIEGNGNGTILTTTSCLLNPNRNPQATQQSMEEALCFYMQARHVVWLPGEGIIGDDTDGHIDQVARFVDERRVLLATPWQEDAPEAEDLRANWFAVANSTNQSGESLLPIPLRMPSPKFQQGSRLPACYCNYALVNGGVIVPTFQDPSADDAALQVLQDCYPDRTVVGVDALDLVWGLGAIHCMSQQQPRFGL
ncbi:MAG: agmatine deiminase family protein [Planctomycetaceae bacterium]